MEKFRQRYLRPCRKWTDILPVAWVLTFVLVLIGQLAWMLLVQAGRFEKLFGFITGNQDAGIFMGQYFLFIGIWLVIFAVFQFPRWNRPMWKTIRKNGRGNSLRGILAGALIGFGMNGFCILLSVILGDIRLSFDSFRPIALLLFLLAVGILSGAEEIVTRVYLYQKLRRRYRHPAVAIVGNALFFGILHVFNPDFSFFALVQIIAVAVLFSLFVYYYESFWGAVMIHTLWNYTQSILFGLPNSGIVSAYSLFRLDAASARNGIFYNVGFGVEGSVGACLIIILVTVLVYLHGKGRKEREDLWKAEEEAMTALQPPEGMPSQQ